MDCLMHFRFIGFFLFIASLFSSDFSYAIDFSLYEIRDSVYDIRGAQLSPDNQLIFFESTEDFLGENINNVEQLYVMSVDGKTLNQITKNGTDERVEGWFNYPQDESFMVFKVERDGLCEVYRYDLLDKLVSLSKNNSLDNTGCLGSSYISFHE
jgi:Tol biopolymer transport system component